MADILFNKRGLPVMISSDRYFASVRGDVSSDSVLERQKEELSKLKDTSLNKDFIDIDEKTKMVNWGRNNNFPQWADNIISSTSVLNSGLRFIRNFTIGQGIMACRVVGYKDNGDEILEAYGNADVNTFINSRNVREYLENTARDYFKYGSSAVQLIGGKDKKSVVSLHTINAYHWRLSDNDRYGRRSCIISHQYPQTPVNGEYKKRLCLLDYSPQDDLQERIENNNSVVFVIRDSWSNNDIYGEPIWLSAYSSGWIDIAKEVPLFLKKIYKNQASWKWHIQIPNSFWEDYFKETDYVNPQERSKAIEDWIDAWERNNLGSENAEKPIITGYSEGFDGKAISDWKIEALDGKSSTTDNLVTSAAANSEILFALMINPNVLGAGMPGGTYAGNQGGSNIREGFLVNIANAWIDRQNLLDPIYLKLRQDGFEDVTLRYKNTILTTLDKGAGTAKNLA